MSDLVSNTSGQPENTAAQLRRATRRLEEREAENWKLKAENARMQAEVERLTASACTCTCTRRLDGPPTKEGWYWVVMTMHDTELGRPFHVTTCQTGARRGELIADTGWRVADMVGSWYGPICEPSQRRKGNERQ